MKCKARISESVERPEHCIKKARFEIVFHDGEKSVVCVEHNNLSKTIDHLIIGRKALTL